MSNFDPVEGPFQVLVLVFGNAIGEKNSSARYQNPVLLGSDDEKNKSKSSEEIQRTIKHSWNFVVILGIVVNIHHSTSSHM